MNHISTIHNLYISRAKAPIVAMCGLTHERWCSTHDFIICDCGCGIGGGSQVNCPECLKLGSDLNPFTFRFWESRGDTDLRKTLSGIVACVFVYFPDFVWYPGSSKRSYVVNRNLYQSRVHSRRISQGVTTKEALLKHLKAEGVL